MMSEWYDNQKKPNRNFRKLLQERIEKSNPRRRLSTEETKHLIQLAATAEKLARRKRAKPSLQTWLSEDEYAQIEHEWQNSLNCVKSLKTNQAT